LDSKVTAHEIEHAWLLPLLKGPYSDAPDRLPSLMTSRGWSAERASEVSLPRLVVIGLTFGSAHWFSAAVDWLEQGFPIDPDIARAVDERKADASLSQAARHAAYAIVRRWEKGGRTAP
jgi:hypothetical protein